MSKSSELDQVVKQYILSCIDGSGYGAELNTTQEKIEFLFDTFTSEFDHRIKYKGIQSALEDWLPGLPSSCNIEYRNYEICKLAVLWGSLPSDYSESQADKILGNWWRFIAGKTCQLFSGYNIPVIKQY